MNSKNRSSIDQSELKKFSKTDKEWWDLSGEFKSLHEINPVRIEYINSVLDRHFKTTKGLRLIDIGCGGGLICEPMSQYHMKISGLDANAENIKGAKIRAERNEFDIKYIHSTVEEHLKSENKYDVILCLEVIEHVANPEEFTMNVSKLLAPGGVIIFSTINRTLKAYLFAIIMAEYVLGWVPKKTHDYSKFIKPSEFVHMLQDTGFSMNELKGLSLSSTKNKWHISDDINVNYFAVFSN